MVHSFLSYGRHELISFARVTRQASDALYSFAVQARPGRGIFSEKQRNLHVSSEERHVSMILGLFYVRAR